MHYLSIGALFRMENPWLDEWIRYHAAVGVEKFYLVCHDTDTRVPDKILQPYILQGLVELRYVRDMPDLNQSPTAWVQRDVYRKIIRHVAGQTRWIAMIDLDEFLLPKHYDDVREVLAEYEECPGLAVNWQVFGTNNHVKRPATQINHLLHRAETDWERNRTIKSIVRPDQVIIKEIPNTHYCHMKHGHIMTSNHSPVSWYQTSDVATDKIQLNHYMLRSWQDFWEVKAQRARNIHAQKCDEHFFNCHDRNEVFDDEISKRFGRIIDAA
jgi:hypothetical protein